MRIRFHEVTEVTETVERNSFNNIFDKLPDRIDIEPERYIYDLSNEHIALDDEFQRYARVDAMRGIVLDANVRFELDGVIYMTDEYGRIKSIRNRKGQIRKVDKNLKIANVLNKRFPNALIEFIYDGDNEIATTVSVMEVVA